MKTMLNKNLMVAALATVATVGAVSHASAVEGLAMPTITAEASAATALNWRGLDLSDRKATVGVGVSALTDYGVFGAANLHTVNLPAPTAHNGAQYMLDTTLGYTHELGQGLRVGVAYTDYRFAGYGDVEDFSFGELGLTAAWKGASVAYTYTADGNVLRVPGMTRGDRYLELGYTHQFGPISLGGLAGYAWYAEPNLEAGWRHVTLQAGYQVNHNFGLTAELQVGGKDAFKQDWEHNNKLTLGGRYVF